MAAEAVAVGAATNFLTGAVTPLLRMIRDAKRCPEECGKLEEQVTSIQSNVQHIRKQMQELLYYDPNVEKDLKVMVGLLEKLKKELDLASIRVHKTNTASKFRIMNPLLDSRLAKKIMAHNAKLEVLASELVPVNLHVTNMLNAAREKCPSSVWQKWNREKNDILFREESTRLLEHSVHGGSYGSGTSRPRYSTEDSNSSHHSPHHMNHPNPRAEQYHRSYTTPN